MSKVSFARPTVPGGATSVTASSRKTVPVPPADKEQPSVEETPARASAQAPARTVPRASVLAPERQTTAPPPTDIEVLDAATPGRSAEPARTSQMSVRPKPQSPSSFVDDSDSVAPEDLQLPTINIVQGVGELCRSFDPGAIVLGKQIILTDAPPKSGDKAAVPQVPVEFVMFGWLGTVRWTEKTDGSPGMMCDTEEEVYSVGGTTNYSEAQEKGLPLFRELRTALVFVKQPAGNDDSDAFPYEVGDTRWSLAKWHLSGVAYTNAARPLLTSRRAGTPLPLRESYSSRVLRINTRLKAYTGGHAAYIPVLSAGEPTSAAIQDARRNLIAAPSTPSGAE